MISPEELLDPVDIIAHLFFASGTADCVRLVTPGGTFEGVFRFPEDDAAWVIFPDGAPALPAGTRVSVEYEGLEDTYLFETVTLGARPDAVQLALPGTIAREDRRLTCRVALPRQLGAQFVEVTTGRPFLLDDISDGGVGLLDPHGALPGIGARVEGTVHVPGLAPFAATVEVRHAAVRADGRRVGARFLLLAQDARAALARYLHAAYAQEALAG